MSEKPQRNWADKVFDIFQVIFAIGIAELFVESLFVPFAQWGWREYYGSFVFALVCLSLVLQARSYFRRRRANNSPAAPAS